MNARDQVLNWASRIAKWAPWSANNGFGRGYVQGPVAQAQLSEKPIQNPVRILQHFGFRSTPLVQGGEAVVVACRAGSTNSIAVVVDNQQVGPKDLKEGEVCVYNSKDKDGTKCRVKLDENGDVSVNGGTAKVGRVGDSVGWLVWIIAPDASGFPVVTGVDWSGTDPMLPTPPPPPTPVPPGTYARPMSITHGADHFKA